MIARTTLMIGLVGVFACSGCSGGGEGSPTTLRGFLGPLSFVDPNDPGLPSNPTNLTISVRGRNPGEFPVTFLQESPVPGTYAFRMSGLPALETLMFRISGGGLEDTSTFPILVNPDRALYITAVPAGVMDAIAQRAANVVLPGESQPRVINLGDRGTIFGIISPEGMSCPGMTRVSLVDRSGGAIDVAGPYYFNSDGSIRVGSFGDVECNYVIFNIQPGDYELRFIRSAGSETRVNVVVLRGVVSVGYKIPES